MKLLQGFHLAVAVLLHVEDALEGSPRRGDGGHVRDLCLNGRLAQVAVIVGAFFADGRIDDQIDLAVGNHIQDIRTSFVQLVYALRGNSVFLNELKGPSRGENLEAAVSEASGDFHYFRLVLAVYGDQYGSAKRQSGLSGFLRLEEGFAVGVG